jgi:rhodanese-related sulfurtransferase
MDIETFKSSVYKEMAEITKALGNSNRLEIIDLLAQGPASVEYISEHTKLSTANASQHLQVLRNSKLVTTDRQGKYIYYSLSGNQVFQVWCALRRLGFSQNAELARLVNDYRENRESLETVTSEELMSKLGDDEVVVVDVRPKSEYELSHIKNAKSLPISELQKELDQIPKGKKIVAYCRGPLCVMADDVIEMLKQKGYDAARLEKGFPDWVALGLPVEGNPPLESMNPPSGTFETI